MIFYDYSTLEEAKTRTKDADVVVVNKVLINKDTIGDALNLKLVCVTATGTNNLDKDYLKSRNIKYRNVENYSTESVAQHIFAMLFYLLEQLAYSDYYKNIQMFLVVLTRFEARVLKILHDLKVGVLKIVLKHFYFDI